MQIRRNLPDIRTSYWDSSGVYTCKSVVNDLKHGNYICKSEGIHLRSTTEALVPHEDLQGRSEERILRKVDVKRLSVQEVWITCGGLSTGACLTRFHRPGFCIEHTQRNIGSVNRESTDLFEVANTHEVAVDPSPPSSRAQFRSMSHIFLFAPGVVIPVEFTYGNQ